MAATTAKAQEVQDKATKTCSLQLVSEWDKTFPNTKKLNRISISHPVGNNAIGIFFIFLK